MAKVISALATRRSCSSRTSQSTTQKFLPRRMTRASAVTVPFSTASRKLIFISTVATRVPAGTDMYVANPPAVSASVAITPPCTTR